MEQDNPPDPAELGVVPPNPEHSGPYLIVDERGRRRWALWHANGRKARGDRQTGAAPGRRMGWTYIGRALPVDGEPIH